MSEAAVKNDMRELTKSYYDALKRIKELNEENTKLKEKVVILELSDCLIELETTQKCVLLS